MTRFFAGPNLVPVVVPEDVRPFLGKPDLHWKPRYSAYELAMAWVGANGFPESIARLLGSVPEYKVLTFERGAFERGVGLRTPGRDSQIDLMVEAKSPAGSVLIAVEGKVAESFGKYVRDLDQTDGVRTRVSHLCATLKLDELRAAETRYQLIHRTASALFAAQELQINHALMLVHAFTPAEKDRQEAFRNSLADYVQFGELLGVAGATENAISAPRLIDGVSLRLGWLTSSMCTA